MTEPAHTTDLALTVRATADAPAPTAAQPPRAAASTATAPVTETVDRDHLLATARATRGPLASRRAAWDRYLAVAPDDDAAMTEFAMVLTELTHFTDALRLAQRAVAVNPANGQAWFVVAYCHTMRREMREAREARDRCEALGGRWAHECRSI